MKHLYTCIILIYLLLNINLLHSQTVIDTSLTPQLVGHTNLKQSPKSSKQHPKKELNSSFHLIAASYSDFVIANQAAKLYQQKGYSDAKVISEGGKHRVSISSYSSEEKAKQEAKSIGFSVWVMKSK